MATYRGWINVRFLLVEWAPAPGLPAFSNFSSYAA